MPPADPTPAAPAAAAPAAAPPAAAPDCDDAREHAALLRHVEDELARVHARLDAPTPKVEAAPRGWGPALVVGLVVALIVASLGALVRRRLAGGEVRE